MEIHGFATIRQAAHIEMCEIWHLPNKFQMERQLWLEVMAAQVAMGFAIPPAAMEAYEKVVQFGHVDLDSIRQRELVTHHDVKARLEEFNALAGYQYAHLAMTGRDLDDNVEQYQQRLSLELLSARAVQLGQPTIAADLGRLASRVKFRGIVGAVGTGQDMIDLMGGDPRNLQELNDRVQRALGFQPGARLDAVGQVYPRSLDFMVASSLTATLSALPLPAGGTSPYPVVMRGYVSMLAELSGDQWGEGDVSCSVVRRVALEGLFLAASARLEQLQAA